VRARLLSGFLFFAICLGLGYAGVGRYDVTKTRGLRDSNRYVEMVRGTSNPTVQQDLRVLVPALARPISWLGANSIGKWSPELLGLLVVNSFFVAWCAVLLMSIAERVVSDDSVARMAALLYLLTFNITNFQLAGLVDSVEAWAMLAITWAVFNEHWRYVPLIGIVGALGKDTTLPVVLPFCIAWTLQLVRDKSRFRAALIGTLALLVVQLGTLVVVRYALTGDLVLPWELANSKRNSTTLGVAIGGILFNRELLYSFGWLLPLGLIRLRQLPAAWIISSAASLVTILLIGVAWGIGGNVSRPAFNAIAPILTLSAAIWLSRLGARDSVADTR